MEWHKDLCDYYNVTPEVALELGTRASGRKPSLPSSETCEAISNKTFEDIWEQKPRKTEEDVFDFYRDQQAWASFRQCVRHKDNTSFHLMYLNQFLKQDSHICEYGCGVAPFLNTLCELAPKEFNARISISDVDNCEHFNFASWRLARKIKDRGLGISLSVRPIKSGHLPVYENKLDLVFCFEVIVPVLLLFRFELLELLY